MGDVAKVHCNGLPTIRPNLEFHCRARTIRGTPQNSSTVSLGIRGNPLNFADEPPILLIKIVAVSRCGVTACRLKRQLTHPLQQAGDLDHRPVSGADHTDCAAAIAHTHIDTSK